MKRAIPLLSLVTLAAYGASPQLVSLEPRGAQQGRTFSLTLSGRNLKPGAKVSSTLPAAFTPLTPKETSMVSDRSLPLLVELKQDAPVGTYPIRVETDEGLSNILLFTVGAFPEMQEAEAGPNTTEHTNDSVETAEAISQVPVTINGTLRGPDRDVYRLAAKAGQRIVFEVEARRCGSAVDPVLRVLDANGKQLARNTDAAGIGVDARLDLTLANSGTYYVEVQDARFSKLTQNFYRLKVGSYAYADGVFPLGGRRGEPVQVEFYGRGLPSPATATVTPQADVSLVPVPGAPVLPFTFAASELPEQRESPGANITLPAVVNGRIAEPGEVDEYRIPVTPGEQVLFEIQARELGTSQLDAMITVMDDKGKKLASAGDAPPPQDVFNLIGLGRTMSDPFVSLVIPPDCKQVSVKVEDVAGRGGPAYGYRLVMRKSVQEFQLTLNAPYLNLPDGGTMVIPVTVDRRGYNGPIQLSLAEAPSDLRVEGGYIPPENIEAATRTVSRRGVLSVTLPRGSHWNTSELVVVGEAKLADGSMMKRTAHGPGMLLDVSVGTDRSRPFTTPWLGLALPASRAKEPVAILEVIPKGKTKMEQGYYHDFAWKFTSARAGVRLPEKVDVDIVGIQDIRVTKMKREGNEGTFTVTTTKATMPAGYNLFLSGRIMTDGEAEVVYSRPAILEVPQESAHE